MTAIFYLIAAYGTILSYVCVQKYLAFGYHSWDLALYNNILWNIVHGKMYVPLIGKVFLSDHASLIAFVAAIPYALFQHPVFLLIFQSFAIGVSVLPIYLIARDKLGNVPAFFCAVLYLCYPALCFANLYEFNLEILAVPMVSFAFYFLVKNKTWPFILMCVMASLCKENIPLTVIALGIFGLLRPHRRMLGFWAILIGAGFFMFDMRLLPVLADKAAGQAVTDHTTNAYMWLFSQYGNNPCEIIMYVITHPVEILKTLFTGRTRLNFFQNIFGVLLYLPLLRPDVLLVNVPHILLRLLSSEVREQTIFFHSAAPLAPVTFFALVFSLHTIFKKFKQISNCRYYLLGAILVIEITMMAAVMNNFSWMVTASETAQSNTAKRELLKMIPEGAGVAASFVFLPQLSSREKLHSAHILFKKGNRIPSVRSDVEYILIDMDDILLPIYFESPALFNKNLLSALKENHFELVKARGDMLLFKRGYAATWKLITVGQGDAANTGTGVMRTPEGLILADIKSLDPDTGTAGHFIFTWRKADIRVTDHRAIFIVRRGSRVVSREEHLVGYGLYPPSLWSDETVTENYWLIMPDLGPGDYTVSMALEVIGNEKPDRVEYQIAAFKK